MIKSVKDLCKCGHSIGEHYYCDCPNCHEGPHDCYAKVKVGNNNDFCDCDQFIPRSKHGK